MQEAQELPSGSSFKFSISLLQRKDPQEEQGEQRRSVFCGSGWRSGCSEASQVGRGGCCPRQAWSLAPTLWVRNAQGDSTDPRRGQGQAGLLLLLRGFLGAPTTGTVGQPWAGNSGNYPLPGAVGRVAKHSVLFLCLQEPKLTVSARAETHRTTPETITWKENCSSAGKGKKLLSLAASWG